MSGTDHPPSTSSSARAARRATTSFIAAMIAIALPMALVAATAGGNDLAGAGAEKASATVDIERFEAQAASAGVAFRAQAAQQATTTTTTAPPPPPTTTTAPPPPPPTTAPPPPPPPAPEPVAAAPASGGTGYSDPSNPAAWDRLAGCESGGNWAINTGNGYYGGLQFSLSSWQAVGGTGYPHEHSRETQIAMGQRLHAQGGWGHWPGCARQLGYM